MPTASPGAVARRIGAVDGTESTAQATRVDELDRVLGGGLVPGGVLLLAGEPGIGKSTLLLDLAARAAEAGERALYVTAEESAGQVKRRADRLGMVPGDLFLAAVTSFEAAMQAVEQVDPRLLVLDSVQTMATEATDGVPGGVTQVRQIATDVAEVARARRMSTILVGHVTKDGTVAGPRTLEHLVDVVLSFEGERDSALRLLRAMKNRYGPTDEVGYFQMEAAGLAACRDPAGLFLGSLTTDLPGTCRTVVMDGRRPLALEVQALVSPGSAGGQSRRTATGLDNGRLAMLLAVLERRCGLRLSHLDVHTASTGGIRVRDPAADLAVALAVAGSAEGLTLPRGVTAVGEIGLTGEIHQVPRLEQRIAEALRRGAPLVMAPPGAPEVTVDGQVRRPVRAATVAEALDAIRQAAGRVRSLG